ncbi:MAG: hypothetical protein CBC71_01570 [Rhodobacteraceae bacterium TMED111]|nr:MAG: hypothetical protein CBC71_01570 [Rhodobacteraceae bacterium TMED111]
MLMNYPNLGNRYHFFESSFARGGSGEIYRVLDRYTGKIVAIKRLFSSVSSDEMIYKFKTEANIYLMLNHPNIVCLNDFIIKDGIHYLVMEYVDGMPLDKYISEETGPMSTSLAKNLMSQILDAVYFAHTKRIPLKGYKGVLHLDLKPSNILITKSKSVKIIDYGISQGTEEQRAEKIIGTPLYMAPEQYDLTQDLTIKTDIYSLGLILHQMVTGDLPYRGCRSNKELFERILLTQTDRITDIYKYVNRSFQNIIDHATVKDASQRYGCCMEMKDALQSIN